MHCLPSKALAASTKCSQSSGPSTPVSGRGMRTGSCCCCCCFLFLSCSSSELSGADRSPGKRELQCQSLWTAHVSHNQQSNETAHVFPYTLSSPLRGKNSPSDLCEARRVGPWRAVGERGRVEQVNRRSVGVSRCPLEDDSLCPL